MAFHEDTMQTCISLVRVGFTVPYQHMARPLRNYYEWLELYVIAAWCQVTTTMHSILYY